MSKEGVTLTFLRESRDLIEVNLSLIKEEKDKYIFHNKLPIQLWLNMHLPQVSREEFGPPANSHPPFELVKRRFGGVDHYIMRNDEQQISMLLHYNLAQTVNSVAFKPTSLVQWKELDPSLIIK